MDVVSTLEEAGFEIVGEGADGERKPFRLQKRARARILLVMDIKMPKLDGNQRSREDC